MLNTTLKPVFIHTGHLYQLDVKAKSVRHENPSLDIKRSSLFLKIMNCELPGISLKTLSNLPSDAITRIIVKKKLSFGKRNSFKSSFFCLHRPMSKRTVSYMNLLLSVTVSFSLFPLSSESMHHIIYVCAKTIQYRQFNIVRGNASACIHTDVCFKLQKHWHVSTIQAFPALIQLEHLPQNITKHRLNKISIRVIISVNTCKHVNTTCLYQY